MARYVGPGYSDNTPKRRYYSCRVRRLDADFELNKEYVTETCPDAPVIADDTTTTFDGWNDESCYPVGCECENCLKSFIWSELPNGGTITKSVFMAKNEPDDEQLRCVHPYSLCILKQVQQFTDRFEKNVMPLNDDFSMLFEDFMRVNHKLAKNASTTTEWINLIGTYMLVNPKYALSYKTVYGNQCCAFVLQHMLVQSDNPHIVEMLRCFLKMNGKCPTFFP